MNVLDKIRNEQVKPERYEFNVGDTIKISVKIVEGDTERIQMFQGTVIARRGQGIEETFTVRRVQAGMGVERVFPMNSPVSPVSKSSVVAMSGAPSCTTSATRSAKLPASKSCAQNNLSTPSAINGFWPECGGYWDLIRKCQLQNMRH